ncbi:MAG: Aspartyl/glutamyl-tRNA(Asn/Gln) amidotransferase subunit C [Candidatus Giovannonibacteria bacterium GW2011_GWA2_44_13b]|uniref:Aspartyl/glutamyl-tRNA(Asn/Gln) amidotransferase subunit C n=2 Tax=Candidatus Giovannoniibacteriota TaxID=1752738 RepID=A0A0G1JZC7_9BACT|nr:MAG: Aspartyl/glutamyl-tRNA(Asn/Gln) amidotransferase subunit C [Candidatus Giovannonibacteria bacterium GW2011_GWA2_44_13b]OGF82022.1 MAG: hypothetical protein A2924_00260 [Candidatus Giovannonibacteria bacterium RIFCSPLOWO2_01_FULL_44_16]
MISKEDIEHLKDLARLPASTDASQGGEFGAKETEKLAGDLGAILAHIDSLKDADVSGVSEIAHAADLKNIFRADAPADSPRSGAAGLDNKYETAGDLINAFPEKFEADHGTYLKVKSIL